MKDKLDITKYMNATASEIEGKVLDLKKSLMEARFAQANGSIKDTSVISRTRHAIATLLGYITNKKAPKAAAAKAPKAAKPKAEKPAAAKPADKKPAPAKKPAASAKKTKKEAKDA